MNYRTVINVHGLKHFLITTLPSYLVNLVLNNVSFVSHPFTLIHIHTLTLSQGEWSLPEAELSREMGDTDQEIH